MRGECLSGSLWERHQEERPAEQHESSSQSIHFSCKVGLAALKPVRALALPKQVRKVWMATAGSLSARERGRPGQLQCAARTGDISVDSGFTVCTDGQVEKYTDLCLQSQTPAHTATVSWLCTLKAWELCLSNSETPSIQVLVFKHHSH